MRGRPNPDGNARLTATVGVLSLIPILVVLATIVLGVHTFMSLHVFFGLALLPLVSLKLASAGWRFTRYYTGSSAYVVRGAPQLAMRMLAPLLVVATVVLFGSGIAMGVSHGHALQDARRLHGPASVIWLVLLGVHVLVYLRRAVIETREDLEPGTRRAVPGASRRDYAIAGALTIGLLVAVATIPTQHRWVDLRHRHDHSRRATQAAQGTTSRLPFRRRPPRQQFLSEREGVAKSWRTRAAS